RERFDTWLRGYFDRHAFTSLTTEQFLDDFRQFLVQDDATLEKTLKVEEWLEKPGIPSNAAVVESSAFVKVDQQVSRFAAGTPRASLATSGWTRQEWQRFLDGLPGDRRENQLTALDGTFGFTKSGNSEILFSWLEIAIRNPYLPAMPSLERFLTSQ